MKVVFGSLMRFANSSKAFLYFLRDRQKLGLERVMLDGHIERYDAFTISVIVPLNSVLCSEYCNGDKNELITR